MNWNSISALMGRKNEEPASLAKKQEIAKLIRVYDSRVTACATTSISADLAERLSNFVNEMPTLAKRDVGLTGLVQLMEICERSPGQRVPELKLGSFESRAQTSFGVRMPMELEERLRKLLRSLPGVTKRHVISAGLDLILSQCEQLNGGPFPSSVAEPDSSGAGGDPR